MHSADVALMGDVIMYGRALVMSRHANQHGWRSEPLNGQRNGQQPCQHDLQKLAHCQSVRQAAVSSCERGVGQAFQAALVWRQLQFHENLGTATKTEAMALKRGIKQS